MEHIKKYGIIYFILVVAIILVAINWKEWFGGNGNGNGTNTPVDGSGCTTDDGKPGIYGGGICVATGGAGPGGGGGTGNGGDPSVERGSANIPKTYCMPSSKGAQCQPRIMHNGHWYAIDYANTNSTKCCYILIK